MLRVISRGDAPSMPNAATEVEPLLFTGERFIPGTGGAIELEHLHRYAFARQACEGKAVLDIACGEGYGSAMLAQVARSVIGVDIAAEAVEHARRRYTRPGVSFKVGSCAAIPLDEASVDVVVSFETIEHHDEHEEMLSEIRRVLKPGGLMILSSPERFEYSERPATTNEFHVHELYRYEFVELVGRHFPYSEIYDQKVLFGSAILAESSACHSRSLHTAEPFDATTPGLARPVYLIAVASDSPLAPLPTGVFEQPLTESAEWKWWLDTVRDRDAKIHKIDAHVRALESELARAENDRGALAQTAEQLNTTHSHLQSVRADFLRTQDQLGREQARVAAVENELAQEKTQGDEARVLYQKTQEQLIGVQGDLIDSARLLALEKAQLQETIAHCEQLSADVNRWRDSTSALDQQLQNANDLVRDAHIRASTLEQSLRLEQQARESVYRSTSWRVTAPLRITKDLLRAPPQAARRMRESVLRGIQSAYHRAPVPRRIKYKVKDAFFSTFGFAVRNTGAYRDWMRLRSRPEYPPAAVIAQFAAPDTVIAEPSVVAPTYSAAGIPVWVADGIREWAHLPSMRQRIAEVRAARIASFAPTPVSMISIREEEIRSAAFDLAFDECEAPLVTILVPVFNQLRLTLECLTSIKKAQTGVSYEVVLADDASTDETPKLLAQVRNLRIHRNTENLNFLRNCNAALPLARGRYVVYLNNDVQVRDRWLDEMVRIFDSAEDAGAVGPRILYPSGYLQEAGVSFNPDMTAEMIGLNEDPGQPQYSYNRRVDYCSAACLMVPRELLLELGGFSEEFAPAYCEDGDLCLRIQEKGLRVYYASAATVVHHLSSTTAAVDQDHKLNLVARNLAKLADKWQTRIDGIANVRSIAFYLPQFYPFPENDNWWGKGFTEWSNVTKAQPNFGGHYQPHLPADLGFYDLRIAEVMEEQVSLARRYGLGGFCFYYYWFAGKRLLDLPLERMLETGKPDFPFCLCWANENWTRRWDGQDNQILMAQSHSEADDEAVILDLIRYFRSPNYIRIDGRPLLVVYRVTLFPDFARTSALWREVCRRENVGEIYISMVESFELVDTVSHPSHYGCDASIEFPPQGLAEQIKPSGEIINPDFLGSVADYRDLVARYCARKQPSYTRFRGAMPGWDNTPRRQNNSFCFENATPGAFQAWLEHIIDETRKHRYGDERIIFINAWNEWAEGAHLEPDRRFGHTFLEALSNANEGASLLNNRHLS